MHLFRQWKEESYVPKAMHKNLKWSESSSFPIEDLDKTLPWEIIPDKKAGIKPMKKAPTNVFPASYYVPAKSLQKLQATSDNTGLKKGMCALDTYNSMLAKRTLC